MDNFTKLVAAFFLLVFACIANAGYAQLASPPGFSSPSPATFNYAASAANDKVFGRVIHQAGGLTTNVAGKAVKMSAAYRLAANAPRIAAAALYLHPAVRTAAGIASWLLTAKLFWDEAQQDWRQKVPKDILEYATSLFPDIWFYSPQAACSYANAQRASPGSQYRIVDDATCVSEFTNKDTGLVYNQFSVGINNRPVHGSIDRPLSKDEFERILAPDISAPWTMPETVPLELPYPTPLPVEQPFINPQPGTNPANLPFIVPVGDPVPNPSYNPNLAPSPSNQPYIQPGSKIVPDPTPAEPWRVVVSPVDVPVDSPDPVTDIPPQDNPPNNPPSTEPSPGICDQYPDILACQKLDTPEDKDLPTSEKEISISPDSGWGADNASCPSARHLTVQGRDVEIPYDLFCTWARGLRPIILAIAWLSAAYIILGVKD